MIEYRPISDLPNHRIGNDGSLWSGLQGGKWKPRRLQRSKLGYLCTQVRRNGKPAMIFVHREVLKAFVGPPPPGMIACHNNGNSTDNRLENLRWDTHASNMRDIVLHRTQFWLAWGKQHTKETHHAQATE